MDREKIIKILSDIDKYLKDLEGRKIVSLGDLRNLEKYYACSMILFSLLNRVIDLGQEIVISKKFGMPSSYKDIFRLLYERRIVNKKNFEGLKKFVDLRNALSHEYYRADEKKIFDALQEIEQVEKFVSEAKNYLKKN